MSTVDYKGKARSQSRLHLDQIITAAKLAKSSDDAAEVGLMAAQIEEAAKRVRAALTPPSPSAEPKKATAS